MISHISIVWDDPALPALHTHGEVGPDLGDGQLNVYDKGGSYAAFNLDKIRYYTVVPFTEEEELNV